MHSSRKSHSCSKLLPFHNDGAHCTPGKFKALEMVLYTCSDLGLENLIVEVYWQFLGLHSLFLGPTHTELRDLIKHTLIQIYVFLNHIQTIEVKVLETSQEQNRMHPSSTWSALARGLNIYQKEIFQVLIFNKFA